MKEIEKILIGFRKEYLETNSEFLDEFGWDELRKRIGGEKPRLPLGYYGRFLTLSGIIIFVIIFSGFIKVAWASLPGQTLYPVKRLGEQIVLTVTNKKDIQIEERADEIIDISKQARENEKQMDQAIKEYQESVEKVKKEAEKSEGRKDAINKKIEEQEEKVKEIIEKNKNRNKEIQENIDSMEEKLKEISPDKVEEDKDGDETTFSFGEKDIRP